MTHLRLKKSGTACVVMVLIALCCAGCGRRGRLDLPPDDEAAAPAASGSGAATAQPAKPHKTKQVPPPTTFFLDPLI